MGPTTTTPATASQKPGLRRLSVPRAATAAATCPADRVTWRTSMPSPKKASTTGMTPSISPSEMLAAKPDTLARRKRDQRSARAVPSQRVKAGLWARAESSRCSTNQFSNQPATMLLANSSTPVKAANSAVGPSTSMSCSTCSAWLVVIMGWPPKVCSPHDSSSTTGTTSARLPAMAATCERNRLATSSTNRRTAPGVCMSRSLATMAGAVTAGCLVATVRCSSCTSTNDSA